MNEQTEVLPIIDAEHLLMIVEAGRIQKGFSARRLSELSGQSHGTYQAWRRKKVVPKMNTLLRYFEVLDMGLAVLSDCGEKVET